MSYNGCVMCESSEGQGCYSDCPTRLQERVLELEKEVQWHKDASARRGEAEAAVLRRVKELEEALRPLAGMFLYPDDLGFEASSDIKEDLDWDDDANDMSTENVFVLRRDIRRARAALNNTTGGNK